MIGSPLNPGNRIRMKMGQTPQVCLTESVMHDSPQHPVIADLGPNESTKLMFLSIMRRLLHAHQPFSHPVFQTCISSFPIYRIISWQDMIMGIFLVLIP